MSGATQVVFTRLQVLEPKVSPCATTTNQLYCSGPGPQYTQNKYSNQPPPAQYQPILQKRADSVSTSAAVAHSNWEYGYGDNARPDIPTDSSRLLSISNLDHYMISGNYGAAVSGCSSSSSGGGFYRHNGSDCYYYYYKNSNPWNPCSACCYHHHIPHQQYPAQGVSQLDSGSVQEHPMEHLNVLTPYPLQYNMSTIVQPSPNPSRYLLRRKARRQVQPDWKAFYSNGYPAEVIVISDDDDDDDDGATTSDYYSTSSTGKRLRTKGSYSDTYSDNNIIQQHGVDLVDDETSPYSRDFSMVDSVDSITSGSMAMTPTQKRRKRGEPLIYVPPRKPIMKAKEVKVPPIHDRIKSTMAYDDPDGHYLVKTDTMFADRYQITKILGQGTFGKVVAAYDKKTNVHCAIKIIRAVEKYREASRIELRVLSTLSMYDKHNVHKCIHLRECFDYRNHICIVTDLLGISIYDFMKANGFLPFPGSHIQDFAFQLFKSVAFLHDLNLIHTDLKPENVLLSSSDCDPLPFRRGRSLKQRKVLRSTSIYLIDFGSAIFDDEHHSSVVSTRHYRAPEIILGIGWSFPCDIWSIGCILVELCTGEALFQTHDNLEHLALMEKVIGSRIDRTVIQQALRNGTGTEYINRDRGIINYPNNSVEGCSIKYVNSIKTFDKLVQSSVSYSKDRTFWNSFLDLLHKIFVYDANKRITARQALSHPWFKMAIMDDGSRR
jgi:dual-specificity kinase